MSNRNRSSFQMFSFVLAFKGTKNIILFFQLWAWVSTIVVFIGLFCFCFMPFSYSGVSLGVKHFQALKISYYDSNTLFLHISHIHFWSRVLLFHLPFQNMTLFCSPSRKKVEKISTPAGIWTRDPDHNLNHTLTT